jgi:hypothetical protein
MLNCAGIANTGRYFNSLPTGFNPPPPPPPPPTADQIMAQAEVAKVQNAAHNDNEKNQQARFEAMLEDDRLRDEARVKAILAAADLTGKYGLQLDSRAIGKLLDADPAARALLLGGATPPPGAAPPGGPPMPPGGLAPGGMPPPGAAVAGTPAAPGGVPPIGPASAPGAAFLNPQLIAALAAANRNQAPPNPMAGAGAGLPPRPPAAPPPTLRPAGSMF